MSSAGTGLHFVSFSLDAWSPVWLNRHHIMSRVAQHHPVLFVSRRARPSDLVANYFLHHLPRPGLRRLGPRLLELVPSRLMLRSDVPLLDAPLRALHIAQVREDARLLGGGRRVLYLWHPTYAPMMGRLGESLVVFHCYDYYPGYPWLPDKVRRRFSAQMSRLLERADLVFASGEAMRAQLPRDDVHVIPNGVDYELFATAHDRTEPPPPEMARIPQPIVAHIGRLQMGLDFALLAEIARRRRDWSVLLLGPVPDVLPPKRRAVFDAFRAEPNAYYIEGKPVAELPRYLRHVAVGLMAYRMEGWVKTAFPLKLFEYLAAGKPCVGPPLEENVRYGDYVTVAESPDEWVAAIEHWLAHDSEELARKRMALARENSWDLRCRRILELIHSKLETAGKGGLR